MNITFEQEMKKEKSDKYDGMFYSLLNSINKGLEEEEKAKFDKKEKTLYISGKINANSVHFLEMCENYKFFIQAELI